MEKAIYTQAILVKYYQAGGAPGQPFDKVYYTIEMKARTYMEAIEFLNNIAASCHGIITETHITLINKTIKGKSNEEELPY